MRAKFNRLLHSKYTFWGIISFFIAFITFMQFQLSVSRIPFLNAKMTLPAFLWNLLSYWLIFALLFAIFNRLHIAILIWSTLSFLISFINYYVLLYHGAPLTFYVLGNTTTALDVLDSYKFSLDKYSAAILIGFLACNVVTFIVWKIHKNNIIDTSIRKRLCIIAACIVLIFTNIYVGIFSDFSFKPKSSIEFSWASSAGEYGFLALQIESHFQENSYTLSYENYSEEAVRELYDKITAQSEQYKKTEYPDIILILNECFYDLEQVIDLDTNISPLSNYYKIENAIKGYVVASGEGGGTNRSEYELLTSVSTSLLPNQTPFQTLDLEGQYSIVSFLEEYGYDTYAAHCAKSANYNRSYGYPALGFNHSYFDLDFKDLENYGNRANTDASTYKNLITWYEQPSNNPKFMYLLTYQNHGGWEQNPENLDTVKVKNDFGEYTSQVNEYLSSLRLSDIELVNLLSYFETVDKPVIVCMLGDHGPSFAKNICDPSIPEKDLTYLLKSTPMLIWSNYGLESQNLGYISMNYVAPKLLDVAGFPLSPFYKYQLDLMNDIPVIISYNIFFDHHMNISPYDDNSYITKKVQDYFNVCFNNLQTNRYHSMFKPIK